eukprot:TRINITY_DN5511_c0_g2_i1.p3 TRINITY_DN5511_c0_g2~~TRINITY_DN5511_c0_g2_i1.p3  ORF type:complete len:192 (-),score=14.25 TRINITY_DN5511_c0_g2_i1:1675-2250(-)
MQSNTTPYLRAHPAHGGTSKGVQAERERQLLPRYPVSCLPEDPRRRRLTTERGQRQTISNSDNWPTKRLQDRPLDHSNQKRRYTVKDTDKEEHRVNGMRQVLRMYDEQNVLGITEEDWAKARMLREQNGGKPKAFDIHACVKGALYEVVPPVSGPCLNPVPAAGPTPTDDPVPTPSTSQAPARSPWTSPRI